MSEKSKVFPTFNNKGNCTGLREGNKPYDISGLDKLSGIFEEIQKICKKKNYVPHVIVASEHFDKRTFSTAYWTDFAPERLELLCKILVDMIMKLPINARQFVVNNLTMRDSDG